MKCRTYIYSILFFLNGFLIQSAYSQCSTGGDQKGGLGGGGSLLEAIINYLKEWHVKGVAPNDPNAITGPTGFAAKQWVSVKDKMNFTIEFENDGQFASAPAQNVYIHLPINPKININSFRLGSFGFGSYTFQVPENTTYYTTRLNVKDSFGVYVDVTAGIDIVNNEIIWIFKSIDSATGQTPKDIRGFLAVSDTGIAKVSDTTNKGKGFVSFLISPASNSITGDTVVAQASIIFDINEPLPTNTWINTVDAVAPTSKGDSVAADVGSISLHWSGRDDASGSGVRDYALYYSENGGAFTLYKSKIAGTSTTFTGTPGRSYCFFTLATDNTGNQEPMKKGCDGSLSLTLGLDGALPVTWLYFKAVPDKDDALLSWATATEKNTKEFKIERSLDGIRFTSIGTVAASGTTTQTSNYTYTDKAALNLNTKMLYYRLKQIDIDGKSRYSDIAAIPVNRSNREITVQAYPNPFNQAITLKVITVTNTDQTDMVSLYSLDGRILYQRKLSMKGSATILLQDLPSLTPGVYLLKTSVNGKMYTIKMVRQG